MKNLGNLTKLKTILLIVILPFVISSCSLGGGKDSTVTDDLSGTIDKSTIEFGNDNTILLSVLPNSYQAECGDEIEITISGTSDVAIDTLYIQLFDNGQAASGSWNWIALTGKRKIKSSIKAETTFDFDFTLFVGCNSSSAGSDYNKIQFSTGADTLSSPTLTLSSFTYSITKNTESIAEKVPNTDLNSSASSFDFAKNLTVGINWANSLDSWKNWVDPNFDNEGLSSQTDWGTPYTIKKMLDGIKSAGFKVIRIPITWHNHLTDSDYTIDSEWMSRVKQVVNWAYKDGFYVIINIMHDNCSSKDLSNRYGYNVDTDTNIQSKSKEYLESIWTQIAENFNNQYDEHLIFETMNEPVDDSLSFAWNISDTTEVTLSEASSIVTDYEQTCVDTIRASGGNNKNRYILVPDYGAGCGNWDTASWVIAYTMPTDSVKDKLILSIHFYMPYYFVMADENYSTFTEDDEKTLDNVFSITRNKFSNVGIVMGETGAVNSVDLSEKLEWITYFFGRAYNTYNMPVLYWDNGNDLELYNRDECKWYFPSIAEAALSAVGITSILEASSDSPEN